ncbi:glycosyltransferase family 2 protein [Gorillibacterium timonense]|uniref:glycosyltransferase family 2 protein n=1 Tax=Gorillibacterium timonense TaxID=1689269 RepID=UPI00071C82FB|nr:glycosyltransferase family 2 protein [Gorillibacterium timonense]
MKTVSVHIVTYNSEKDITACLKAVVLQSYPVEKVIVVDNASDDDTLDMVKRAHLPQLTVISNDRNFGFAAAHNQAIRLSTSDYQLVLNPDVTLHPDYLQELMTAAERHPNAGSLTGLLLSKLELGIVDSAGLVITRSRRAFDRGQGEAVSGYLTEKEVFGVSGAAALYSRQMIEAISLNGEFFDEAFFAYKEDVDVAWRAQWAGWKAFFIPGATASHERGWKKGGRSERPLFIRRYSFENRFRMIWKNDRLSKLMLHLPFILPFEIGQLGYLLLKERDLLSSYYHVWKVRSVLAQQRRTIRHKARKSMDEVYSFFQ